MNLTPRQREIAARIARGEQNKVIAADLGLSEHTVHEHVCKLRTRLGVRGTRTALALALLRRQNT